MGKARSPTIVLDSGALIAWERGDARMRTLIRDSLRARARLIIPAGVLGQVWRDGARQVPLRALVNDAMTEVPPLDRLLAEAAGTLCGRAGTADVVDASVALIAKRAQALVVTSDTGDFRRLDPSLKVESI